jgi:hypothetical protein
MFLIMLVDAHRAGRVDGRHPRTVGTRHLIASTRDVFHERPDSAAEALLAVAEAELAIAEARIEDARRTLRAAAERAEKCGNPIDVWTIRRMLDSPELARQPKESSSATTT